MRSWVLHDFMLDRALPSRRLDVALAAHRIPYTVHSFDYVEKKFSPLFPSGRDVIVYGTKEFCRESVLEIDELNDRKIFTLGLNPDTAVRRWSTYLPCELLLNPDVLYVPWVAFRQLDRRWQEICGGEGVFVRPDSGMKTFTGQVVKYESWAYDCASIDKFSGVMDETLVAFATEKKIDGEFRFVIANQEVIAGSEYRWDDRLDVRADYPAEAREVADKVAKLDWQLDLAYTCDVALTASGPRVVELNSFCCAGLYACDPVAVTLAVGSAVEWLWGPER